MSIYRLIYRSKSTAPIDSALIQSIEAKSKDNNSRLGVTGILVASQSEFLQILEGSIDAVNQVYNRITRDPRHTDVTLLSYEMAEGHEFEAWSMKGVGVGLLGKWMGERLRRKYGGDTEDFTIPWDGQKAFALLYDVRSFLTGDQSATDEGDDAVG